MQIKIEPAPLPQMQPPRPDREEDQDEKQEHVNKCCMCIKLSACGLLFAI